jgi:hypothetical protein
VGGESLAGGVGGVCRDAVRMGLSGVRSSVVGLLKGENRDLGWKAPSGVDLGARLLGFGCKNLR